MNLDGIVSAYEVRDRVARLGEWPFLKCLAYAAAVANSFSPLLVNALSNQDYGQAMIQAAVNGAISFPASYVFSRMLVRYRCESMVDELTGLPNLRALKQRMPEELSRAYRQQSPVFFLQMDLKGLKYVNNNFGLDAGNQLLLEAVLRMKEQLRPYDFVGRCSTTGGSDEFVAVLPLGSNYPNNGLSGYAYSVCERIVDSGSRSPIEFMNGRFSERISPEFRCGALVYSPPEKNGHAFDSCGESAEILKQLGILLVDVKSRNEIIVREFGRKENVHNFPTGKL
ncbi:GGDEF domain-containing protein [Candidatus Woesearchaeota archaeon]|nr:GGDEF domain-containing protein [Candidatus Woesearchaeota archaeon]